MNTEYLVAGCHYMHPNSGVVLTGKEWEQDYHERKPKDEDGNIIPIEEDLCYLFEVKWVCEWREV